MKRLGSFFTLLSRIPSPKGVEILPGSNAKKGDNQQAA